MSAHVPRSTPDAFLLRSLLAVVVACGAGCVTVDYEGDEPLECENGADDDRNGAFDCDDPGCSGSAACSGNLPDQGSNDPNEYISGGQLTRSFSATGALVEYNGSAFCTATLVAPDRVLTAAHCVQGRSGGAIRFALGTELKNASRSAMVSGIFIHPGWTGNVQAGNDLAVLQLSSPIQDVLPANIYLGGASALVGQNLTLVGYGRQASDQVTGIRRLARVALATVSAQTLVYQFNGAGACHGDSGGPAFAQLGGLWRQVGVTSWGDPSCMGQGHYQRLDVHAAWLRERGVPTERSSLSCAKGDRCDGQCDEDEDCWALMCPSGNCIAPSGRCLQDSSCDPDCGNSDPDCMAPTDYCSVYRLYGDGLCHTNCPQRDPDCNNICQPVQWVFNPANGFCFYLDAAGNVCSYFPAACHPYYGCRCV